MKSRLFADRGTTEADVRPTLLGVVTLLFLLLFFLLSTSTGQRLGVIPMRLSSPDALAPLPHSGLLQKVLVRLQGSAIVVEFSLQTTDISASSTSEEKHLRTLPGINGIPDYKSLQTALLELHKLDPSQQRAEVEPSDDVPMEQLLAVLDVVRGGDGAPLFPKLALTGAR